MLDAGRLVTAGLNRVPSNVFLPYDRKVAALPKERRSKGVLSFPLCRHLNLTQGFPSTWRWDHSVKNSDRMTG
ncbi:hypothetical protein CEXT_217711 [Caerostris extrusa]|uniref:Uncharacterized protein n=1 Tax=Caerostris extrusa TaxID=172846 RepID=A0AAV4S8Q6_CAEEX|nr:hypothetical protein CEXT_217711 [Caerostris extrusa]